MSNVELATQFFLQLAIILVACRVVGRIALYFGQPQVVAEMITGVMLGPSLFGLFWPDLQQLIFPWDTSQSSRDTSSYLFPASQLGLALYMFIVGMEFRVDIVRSHFKSSVAVSVAGMVAPFVLGAGLGWWLLHNTSLFGADTSSSEAMLFLGASMCITAFPMLARIIHFKGLAGTPMGTVSLGAGAIDDATAWCLLAVVLASFDGDISSALWVLAAGGAYVAVALLILRPLLERFKGIMLNSAGRLSETGLVLALALMATGAGFTDMIGLHAVFGGFVMGAAMPRGAIHREMIARLQPVVVTLLLPLFFTYSGLNTQIALLNTWFLWGVCGLVLLAAVLGKAVAGYLAARFTGFGHNDAMGIGVLMNSRGLMELIIINIGLERGIISEGLFATLVIMAIVTTLMASPIFDRVTNTSVRDTGDGPSCDELPCEA